MQKKIIYFKEKIEHWIEFLDELKHFPIARKARKDMKELRDFLHSLVDES